MQHPGMPPARRQDRGGGDVAAGEHHIDRVPADHRRTLTLASNSRSNCSSLISPRPAAAGVHHTSSKRFGTSSFRADQAPQPAHGPLLFNGFRDSQSGEDAACCRRHQPGHRVGRHPPGLI